MLLRDITVIEMGTAIVPFFVLLPFLWAVGIPYLWVWRCAATVAGSVEEQALAAIGAAALGFAPGFFFFSVYGFVASVVLSAAAAAGAACFVLLLDSNLERCLVCGVLLYAAGIFISTVRGWMRRPFVYFGVVVSGDRRAGGVSRRRDCHLMAPPCAFQ